jgi:hypothetical protein
VSTSARTLCAGALFVLSVCGCSGLKTYPNTLEKNARIHVRTDGGTLLSRTGIALDLYAVNVQCGSKYLGTVELDDPTIDLGLPLDQNVLLAYVFSRDAILGTSGTTVIEMMVTPRPGERYEFDVEYLKKGYTATGRRFPAGQTQSKDIEHSRLRDCSPPDPAPTRSPTARSCDPATACETAGSAAA